LERSWKLYASVKSLGVRVRQAERSNFTLAVRTVRLTTRQCLPALTEKLGKKLIQKGIALAILLPELGIALPHLRVITNLFQKKSRSPVLVILSEENGSLGLVPHLPEALFHLCKNLFARHTHCRILLFGLLVSLELSIVMNHFRVRIILWQKNYQDFVDPFRSKILPLTDEV
jgi:type III secretory pathway component EscT